MGKQFLPAACFSPHSMGQEMVREVSNRRTHGIDGADMGLSWSALGGV